MTKVKDMDYLLQLLVPQFLERHGRIFFKSHFTETNFNKYWKRKFTTDAAKVERTINHIHLSDLTDDVKMQEKLGKKIKDIWRRILHQTHPQKILHLKLYKMDGGSVAEWVLDLWTEEGGRLR